MRLIFGHPDHIALVESAPELVDEYTHLDRPGKRFRKRIWRKPSIAHCPICGTKFNAGDLVVHLGRRSLHESCLVDRILELRAKLKALGFLGGGVLEMAYEKRRWR